MINVGALAAQTTAKSSAFGESINLNLLPLLGQGIPVASGPLPTVSGTAPAAYNQAGNLASAGVSTVLTGSILSTGVINVHAASAVPGADTVSADANVANPTLNVVQALPLLHLTADTVSSSATIGGSCAAGSTVSGATTIANAHLSGTLAGGLSIATSPAPNTLLLNLAGIRVVLNEQTVTNSGGVRGITVNAIHISL
ncbi:MAG TPA: choice-of-anchor P family protein, partial [Thermoanaerobaculia bacterium]|nr:choice-of-anchor P family protein [Thermoanaerobaculia bacterium]